VRGGGTARPAVTVCPSTVTHCDVALFSSELFGRRSQMRILIIGAAGSGTSTLAQTIAPQLSASVFEADDYFWVPTDPPFKLKRDPRDRLSSILRDLEPVTAAVIAGSIVDWGAELEGSLSLIVFLTVPASVRVHRLQRREQALLGFVRPEFIEWAAQYDEGRLPGRSRQKHEHWLASRSQPILRIDGEVSLEDSASRVLKAVAALA
jgi:adenylate kinase family enzyme